MYRGEAGACRVHGGRGGPAEWQLSVAHLGSWCPAWLCASPCSPSGTGRTPSVPGKGGVSSLQSSLGNSRAGVAQKLAALGAGVQRPCPLALEMRGSGGGSGGECPTVHCPCQSRPPWHQPDPNVGERAGAGSREQPGWGCASREAALAAGLQPGPLSPSTAPHPLERCVSHRGRREPDLGHPREGYQTGSQRLLPIPAVQGRVRGPGWDWSSNCQPPGTGGAVVRILCWPCQLPVGAPLHPNSAVPKCNVGSLGRD